MTKTINLNFALSHCVLEIVEEVMDDLSNFVSRVRAFCAWIERNASTSSKL